VTPPEPGRPSALDRALRVFGDVRAGEGAEVLLMFFNVFLLLVAYYMLKTVREPLILAHGGATLKSYASAAQALTLIAYVPLYGYVASRLPRRRLIVTVVLFFTAGVEVFFFAGVAGLPHVGFVFFVWVGIFSLTTIAQFWSYANDVYSREAGQRLFPLIAVGSTAGAPLGAALAERMFAAGLSAFLMMQIAAGILLLHLALYLAANRRLARRAAADAPAIEQRNGFALVLRSRYLGLIALLLVLLNLVNTLGEYILGAEVVAAAQARATEPGFNIEAFIGSFYGSYFLWVNLGTVVIQAFLVSRLVKHLGLAGVVLALPVVALGAYGTVLSGAGLALLRVAKTAENATDYSVMNTAKQMLWLPTTRAEKYKAKQAIDTFFVRLGDLFSAGVVFVGTQRLGLGAHGFAGVNLVIVVGALLVGLLLLREHRRLVAMREAEGVVAA
jgi:AAA family ATP:ADP antiporter